MEKNSQWQYEDCAHYTKNEDIIMRTYLESKNQLSRLDEQIKKISTQSFIYEPSQNKTQVCSHILTIFSETTNNLLLICNLKEEALNWKKNSKNFKLERFLDEYSRISELISLTRKDKVNSYVLLNNYKRSYLPKKNELSFETLQHFLKKSDIPFSKSELYFTNPNLQETEALRLFVEEKTIEHNDEDVNVHKLILQESKSYAEKGFEKKETPIENVKLILQKEPTITKNLFCQLNSLRVSYGIDDEALRNLCKNIVRETKRESFRNNHSINGVLSDKHFIIREFKSLINIATQKLEKHPIQYFIEKINFEHIKDRTRNYASIAEILGISKNEINERLSLIVNKMDEEVKALRLQISLNEEVTKEVLTNSLNTEEINSQESRTIIYREVKNDVGKLGITDNWIREKEKRNNKYNMKRRVKTTILSLKEMIDSTNKEIDSIWDEYEDGFQGKLDLLQNNYSSKITILEDILSKRERTYRNSMNDQIIEERKLVAAMKIQAWWAGCMFKKHCDGKMKSKLKKSKKTRRHK